MSDAKKPGEDGRPGFPPYQPLKLELREGERDWALKLPDWYWSDKGLPRPGALPAGTPVTKYYTHGDKFGRTFSEGE